MCGGGNSKSPFKRTRTVSKQKCKEMGKASDFSFEDLLKEANRIYKSNNLDLCEARVIILKSQLQLQLVINREIEP